MKSYVTICEEWGKLKAQLKQVRQYQGQVPKLKHSSQNEWGSSLWVSFQLFHNLKVGWRFSNCSLIKNWPWVPGTKQATRASLKKFLACLMVESFVEYICFTKKKNLPIWLYRSNLVCPTNKIQKSTYTTFNIKRIYYKKYI